MFLVRRFLPPLYTEAAFASLRWSFKCLEISLVEVLGSVMKDVPQVVEPQWSFLYKFS